jgi:hypothetical protein
MVNFMANTWRTNHPNSAFGKAEAFYMEFALSVPCVNQSCRFTPNLGLHRIPGFVRIESSQIKQMLPI